MERFATVIVGGGIAGLTAGHLIDRADTLILESEAMVGGRTRSVALGPFVYNQGAQVVLGGDSLTGNLARKLGVPIRRIPKHGLPIYMRGRYIRAATEPEYLLRLPLPIRDKFRLALAIMTARLQYRSLKLDEVDPTDQRLLRLDRQTLASYVGASDGRARALWDTLALNTTGEPSDVVAAIQPILGVLSFRGDEYAIEGGTWELARAIAGGQPSQIRVDAVVTKVRLDRDTVSIDYQQGGVANSVQASRCILAVPAPVALTLVDDLPDWKIRALMAAEFGSDTSAAFLLAEPAERWMGSGIWRVPIVGKRFIGITNPGLTYPQGSDQRLRSGMVRLYLGRSNSDRFAGQPPEGVLTQLAQDLNDVFPGMASSIVDADMRYWKYADSPWLPGRLQYLASMRRCVGPLLFCGDYVDPIGHGLEGAIRSAQWAVAQLANRSDQIVR